MSSKGTASARGRREAEAGGMGAQGLTREVVVGWGSGDGWWGLLLDCAVQRRGMRQLEGVPEGAFQPGEGGELHGREGQREAQVSDRLDHWWCEGWCGGESGTGVQRRCRWVNAEVVPAETPTDSFDLARRLTVTHTH